MFNLDIFYYMLGMFAVATIPAIIIVFMILVSGKLYHDLKNEKEIKKVNRHKLGTKKDNLDIKKMKNDLDHWTNILQEK